MRRCLLFSLVLFLIAFSVIAVSVITGGSAVALFIVIPVIYGGDIFLLAGVALLMISFLSFFVCYNRDMVSGDEGEEKKEGYSGGEHAPSGDAGVHIKEKKRNRMGGVVLIGPIPIVFGSDWKMAVTLMGIALILALIAFFVFFD